MKKGWPQSSLDNGVIDKPSIPGPQPRIGTQQKIGNNMNFFNAIASGENEHGQMTIAPGQVVQGGEVIREQQDYSRGLHGERWKPKR